MGFFNPGETNMQPSESMREPAMVDSQTMQHGCMKVSQMDRIFGYVIRELISLAVLNPTLDTTSRHPACKTAAMVIATRSWVSEFALTEGCPAKFGQE